MMNMYFSKLNRLGNFGVAICLACISSVALSEVESLTTEEFVQYGPEDAYWQFTATCKDGAERIVQRKTDGNNWCSKALEGYCDANRESAAEKVCSEAFVEEYANSEQVRKAEQEASRAKAQAEARKREDERRAADQRAAEQRARQAAAQAKAAEEAEKAKEAENQLSIEEQLLKIEQEKLDLRRQELELQKRAIEIEDILKTEE